MLAASHEEPAMSKFHELTMNAITGEPVSFSGFKGTVCLVVNLASQ
jgi:glutathione peroxidase-family protein